MSGSENPKSIDLRSVFGTAAGFSATESFGCTCPDQAAVVQRLLTELKSDLDISAENTTNGPSSQTRCWHRWSG